MKKEITIIGAGLVGSLLSLYLSRRGYKVSVYERRGDMRKQAMRAGRSINLALSDRGIIALEEVNVMNTVREICIPMQGRFIHKVSGDNAYQPYGKEGQFINSVSRGDLNRILVEAAEHNGVQFFFNHSCQSVNWETNTIAFTTPELLETSFEILFAADGAYSAGRLQNMLQHDRFDYAQEYIDFGYKELTIPAGKNGEFQLDKNALHIWPRGNFMLIALPNMDGSFTGTLFFPFEGETSFASLTTEEKVKEFFSHTFPDVFTLMPTLVSDFFANPTSSLITVKCFPWVREGKFALIGDAAHAIVPFFGQGMNCGFEDCAVLDKLIEAHNHDWTTILKAFQEQRKPDADAIADLALNNFVEMRDKVGDEKFLLQKKIEAAFSARHPDLWIPAYSQVTFSPHIRYSQALESSKAQEEIMRGIMEMPGIEGKWDGGEVEGKMMEGLRG